ncbi:ATP-binding cassette domain-containing protein [Microbacterium sp. 2216-1]|uniref:ATP-binding cassette domain-containing protein n=1 Tax=Microbacterium sp. 2216-1 TaxID=3390053 RepID=UPI00397519C8
MMIVRELWREAARSPALLAGTVLCLLLASATYLAQAFAIAGALAAVVSGDGSRVLAALAAIVGLAVVRMLLMLLQDALASHLGGHVRVVLRRRTLRTALTATRLHDPTGRDGALRGALTDGVDGTDAYVSKYIPTLALVFLACPMVIAILVAVNPWAGLSAGLAVALALIGPLAWKRMMSRRGLDHWDSYEALGADYLDALRGMAMLRALGDVPGTRARLQERSEALRRATERVMRGSLAETGVIDVAIQGGTVAAIMIAVVQAASGQPPAFETYLVLLLVSEAFRPIRDLSRQWHAGFLGLTAVPALRSLGAFHADPPTAPAAEPLASDRPRPAALRGSADRLDVRGVRYRYPSGDADVLDGVDLVARTGTLTAIVGASGAGKSTLLDVLLGLIRPHEGSSTLDGRPLRPDDVAVLSQRPVLFAGTVRENLSVTGARTDAELADACRAAGVLDEVRELPGGFDAVVSEAGMSLSGGQRQRLALARALLARRPVLLVDEPTSALDAARAADVMTTLRHVAEVRIVVMVTHRVEDLRSTDTVVRLAHGRTTPVDYAQEVPV